MAATPSQVKDIVGIVSKYLPLDKAQSLSRELYDRVGLNTDNTSLRSTLKAIADSFANLETTQVGRVPPHILDKNKRGGLQTYADEEWNKLVIKPIAEPQGLPRDEK